MTDAGARPGHGGGLAVTGAGRFTLNGKVTATGPVSVSRAATLGVGAGSSGSVGSLTSAGSLQLDGTLAVRTDLTQTSTGSLSVHLDDRSSKPRITTNGQVTLGGRLKLTGTDAPTARLTLVDNRGKQAVFGGFSGLAEGASMNTPAGAMTLTYRGGDGNDVVLVPVPAASRTAALADSLISSPVVDHLGGPPFLLGGGAVLLLAVLIAAAAHRRRRGPEQPAQVPETSPSRV